MARPLRIEYPGAFYHVTSRGNERNDVFKTLRDRAQFLDYLHSATIRYGAVVHVWCQLSNHYHLLIETPRGNLSEIMHHINGAYTTYFNVKRKRSGHLFQGRFKAILVEAEEYAKELSRYIHLNPVRAGIVERPEDYQWSSYRSYIGEETCPKWLETDFINGYFGNSPSAAKKNYRVFVEDALGRDYENPLDKVVASSILGTEDFTETIIATYVDSDEDDCNIPALRQLTVHLPLDDMLVAVATVFGDNAKQARQAGIYFCHRYSGANLRDIGAVFGLKESAISAGSRRFGLLVDDDAIIRAKVEQVKKALNLEG